MDFGPTAILVVVVLVIFSSITKPGPSVPAGQTVTPPAYVQTFSADQQKMSAGLNEYIYKHVKSKLAPGMMALMAEAIVEFSCQAEVEPFLIAALIERESGFIPDLVSSSGAVGLGQIKPATGHGLGLDNLYDIQENVRGTALYVKKMLDLWAGHDNQLSLALASYKEGYGTVSRSGGCYSAHTAGYIADILNNREDIYASTGIQNGRE